MPVAELVWRKATPDAGCFGRAAQLSTYQRGSARGSARRAVQHTEQRPDRQLGAELKPRTELLKCPAVHSDFASPPALPGSHQDRAAVHIEIGLGERERFADPQPCPPEHDDHAAQPDAVSAVAGGAHNRDDLLDCWRVRRVAEPFLCRPCWHADVGVKLLAECGDGRCEGLHDRVGFADLCFL